MTLEPNLQQINRQPDKQAFPRKIEWNEAEPRANIRRLLLAATATTRTESSSALGKPLTDGIKRPKYVQNGSGRGGVAFGSC